MTAKQLVWLITGTSSGLGRNLALAALARGDKVIATTRPQSLAKLKDIESQGGNLLGLDVTAPLEELHKIAKEAVKVYGRIDVLVNNAGYIEVGAIEEVTPSEQVNQFDTNVFGALNVSRAFLPYMREKKSGTIVFLGSLGGWRSVTNAGLYAATKFAIRGLSETLHDEIAPLGLRSICFDFGYFRTDFLAPNHRAPAKARISDYKEITEKAEASLTAYNGRQPGNPEKGVQVIIDVIKGEGLASGKPFPKVLAIGSDCYAVVKKAAEEALDRLEEWKDVTFSTDFPKGT